MAYDVWEHLVPGTQLDPIEPFSSEDSLTPTEPMFDATATASIQTVSRVPTTHVVELEQTFQILTAHDSGVIQVGGVGGGWGGAGGQWAQLRHARVCARRSVTPVAWTRCCHTKHACVHSQHHAPQF